MTTAGQPAAGPGILHQAALLGGFTALAVALLMAGNLATRDPIRWRQQEDLLASLSQVLPARLHDRDLLAGALAFAPAGERARTVYRAFLDDRITAVAFRVTGSGYAGTMDMLMAVDAGGTVLGVRVLAHTETPGLGDKVDPEKADWIHGFAGRSLGDPPLAAWGVRKDGGVFDQFTGATITPRAVVAAVKDGLVFFRTHRDALLAETPGSGAAPARRDAG